MLTAKDDNEYAELMETCKELIASLAPENSIGDIIKTLITSCFCVYSDEVVMPLHKRVAKLEEKLKEEKSNG